MIAGVVEGCSQRCCICFTNLFHFILFFGLLICKITRCKDSDGNHSDHGYDAHPSKFLALNEHNSTTENCNEGEYHYTDHQSCGNGALAFVANAVIRVWEIFLEIISKFCITFSSFSNPTLVSSVIERGHVVATGSLIPSECEIVTFGIIRRSIVVLIGSWVKLEWCETCCSDGNKTVDEQCEHQSKLGAFHISKLPKDKRHRNGNYVDCQQQDNVHARVETKH